MTTERILTSRLFTTSVIEGRTDLDEKYDKAYISLIGLTKNLSDKESHDVLNKALDDRKLHEEISIGLMVGILSDSETAAKHYQDLTLLSRDSLKVVTDALIHIVQERYSRLQDVARSQLLWLVGQMVKTGINNVEGIVWGLLRQIAGGDISPKNTWLAESLVDVLKENRAWLDKFGVIVASVAYTYLRILEDHHGPQFSSLRTKEVAFVLGLLRERFQDCMKIGRDLVRLLQNIAKIPEIEGFWKDLLHNPASLAPNFTGILQLLQTRTSRRFFVVRLTPEMEKKMVFLCTDVKFGVQKRYQDWFQRQYLNTPESQTLRCDLIRFIIGCIHPSNEVLCSDIIPRWAVIGWLLSSCTSTVATANSKLALFYDWLLYNTDTDNIMNIEPGILVMYHSLRPHPVLTTSLLDFLCRIISNFYPPISDKVKVGVCKSLRQILEKRVVQSLEPLFDNPRMDLELQKLVRDTFLEFCSSTTPLPLKPEDFISAVLPGNSSQPVTKMDLMAEAGLDFNTSELFSNDLHHSNHVDDDAMFSDDEDETKLHIHMKSAGSESNNVNIKLIKDAVKAEIRTEEPIISTNGAVVLNSSNKSSFVNNKSVDGAQNESSTQLPVVLQRKSEYSKSLLSQRTLCELLTSDKKTDLNKHLDYLERDMRSYLQDFLLADLQSRCDLLQKVCDLIFSEDLDMDEASHLAVCLSYLLSPEVMSETSLLPNSVTTETIEESISTPLYILFDNLTTLTEDDHRRQSLLLLLVALHKNVPSMGYRFLYFLKASRFVRSEEEESRSTSLQMYRDLCRAANQKDFAGFILRDIQICCENDPRLISWVIPDIYTSYPKQTVGNAELLQIILERLDSLQLHDLICMVLQGSLQMFDNNSFTSILEKSLQWETVEQIFLWQLARAHEIPVDCCLAVLPKLKFCSHTTSMANTNGEALSNILMMLRRESPSEVLLKPLLLRELRPNDPTVATILQYWVERYEDKMAKLVNDMVNNRPQPSQQPSPNKRKRNSQTASSKSATAATGQCKSVPLDQVLSHLNHLRVVCDQTKFFALATMQEALQTAQNHCSDAQRKRFSDLFALIEEDDDDPEPTSLRKGKGGSGIRGRKTKSRRKHDSESEEESSEEEDVKKPSRKRKKNNQVGSDSD